MAVVAPAVVCARNYTGTVVNAENNTLVELADVSFFANDTVFVGGGWTDEVGVFSVSVSRPANRVVIRCVGYTPFDVSLDEPIATGEVGIIEITPDNTLDEVTVVGEGSITKMNRKSYLITEELRKDAMTPWTVMERLDGFYVDPMTLKVEIGTTKNVTVLVEGRQRDTQYISGLNPKRIKSISVIEHPQGRFSGQDKVIDIRLFTDYVGWSFNNRDIVSNLLSSSANGQNFMLYGEYTLNKWSVSAGMSYAHDYSVSRSHSSTDYVGTLTERTDGDLYDRQCGKGLQLYAGFDYRFTKDRILTLQLMVPQGDYWSKRHGDIIYDDLINNNEIISPLDDRIDRRSSTVAATASYSDKFGQKWELIADVTYSHEIQKQSSEKTYGFDYTQQFSLRNPGDNVMSNVSVTYHALDNLDISVTDQIGYDRLTSTDRLTGLDTYRLKRITNSTTLDLSWFIASRWLIMATAYTNYIHSRSMDYTESKFAASPRCTVQWFTDARQTSTITATYQYSPTYPGLDELSNNTIPMGLLLYKTGNPDMKSGSSHDAILQFRYKYNLEAAVAYNHTDNVPRFMMYNPGPAYYLLEPVPTSSRSVSANVAGNVNFGKFTFFGSFTYSHRWMTAPSSYKAGSDQYHFNVRGLFKLKNYSATVEYRFGHHDNRGLHQLIENYTDDLQLGLHANFHKDRVRTSLVCSLPLHVLPRWTCTSVDYPFYNSRQYTDRFYDSQYVKLSVSINLGNGKSRSQGDRSRFRQIRDIE